MKRLTLFAAASLLATSALALDYSPNCDAPQPTLDGKTMVVRGSTTLRPISVRMMTTFPEIRPDITVLQDALGSSAGIRQWREGFCFDNGIPAADCAAGSDGLLSEGDGAGTWDGRGDRRFGDQSPADICQASRKIRASEIASAQAVGMCVVEHVVAKDGLGIAVASDNDVLRLNADDIRFIFENDMQTACGGGQCTWALLGLGTSNDPVVPVSRTTEGGTFGAFLDLYGVDGSALLSNPSVVFVGSNDEIAVLVGDGTYPGAVGYIGISFQNPALRSVPVAQSAGDQAFPATFATVTNGQFAFSRDLNVYTNGYPHLGDARRDWINLYYSPLGQAHVTEIGFVPVSAVGSPALENVQSLLEPLFPEISRNSLTVIAERLERLAEANAVLAMDPGNSPAQTENIEGQFAIEEQVLSNQRLVDNLLERLADGAIDGISTARLERAFEARDAAADAVADCSPIFPVDCSLEEYTAWTEALERAYREARAASSRGGFDPLHPNGTGRGKL